MQTVTIKGLTRVVVDSALIQVGSQGAAHPAVFGDQLLAYLNQIVAMFNAHVHPGELAGGFLPLTPAPPVPPLPPAAPSLLSVKVPPASGTRTAWPTIPAHPAQRRAHSRCRRTC